MHLDEIFRMTHPTQGELKTIGDIWTRAVPTDTEKAASVLLNPSRKTGGNGTTYPTFTPTKVLPSLKVHGKTAKTVVIDGKRYVVPDDVELKDSVNNGSNTKIDTGIYASDNIEYFVRTKCNTMGSYYIFQARQGTNGTIYGISGSQTNSTFTAHGLALSTLTRTIGHIYAISLKIQNRAVTFTVLDETTGDTETVTGTTSNLVSPTTIGLFGTGNYLDAGEQVYEAWIKKDGALVWYMCPAVKNNAVGAWNPVNDTFTLPTGTLTAGKNTKTVTSGKYAVIDGEYYDGTGVIRQASGFWRLASVVTVTSDEDMSISCGNTSDTLAYIGTDGGDIEPCIDGYDIVGKTGGWFISGPNSAKDLKIYQDGEAIFDFARDVGKTIEVPLYELYGVGEKILDIPDEYERVEYIEGHGTEYIDTGFDATSVVLRVKAAFSNTVNFKNAFGFADISADSNWFSAYRNGNGFTGFYCGSKTITLFSDSDVHEVDIAVFNNNNIDVYVDGSPKYGGKYTGSFIGSNAGRFYLFSFGGHVTPSSRASSGIFKYCEIYQNSTIVHNFRPVKKKSNNEYGMFDTVTQTFYGNASGTGAFTGGPVVSNWSVDVNVGKQDETPTKHSVVLNSQLHGGTDYADTADVQTGEVSRATGIKVLDGTESYAWGNPSVTLSWSNLPALKTGVAPISNYFDGVTSFTGGIQILVYNSSQFRFRIPGITGIADAKKIIKDMYDNGTPVILIYPLAVSTTESATPDPVSLSAKAQYTVENTNLVKGDVQATVLSK